MLSESDKEFIQTNHEKDIDWLVEQTKRSKKDIESYLSGYVKKNALANRVRNQVSSKKGTAIMTGTVSSITDEIKKNRTNTDAEHIHKIRPE